MYKKQRRRGFRRKSSQFHEEPAQASLNVPEDDINLAELRQLAWIIPSRAQGRGHSNKLDLITLLASPAPVRDGLEEADHVIRCGSDRLRQNRFRA